MFLTMFVAVALSEGPVSKFNDHKVTAEYESHRTMEDVERCLIDLDGPGLPFVYRQPDRPDNTLLLWTTKGPLSAPVTGRVDLRRTPGGVVVKSWIPEKWIRQCAP